MAGRVRSRGRGEGGAVSLRAASTCDSEIDRRSAIFRGAFGAAAASASTIIIPQAAHAAAAPAKAVRPDNVPEKFWDAEKGVVKTDALLENVAVDADGNVDYFDTSKTQNGRVSYPIYHIDNWHKPQMAGHPDSVIFLTCDAFGVLPPVSKLSSGQAMYHFLSGYTAKVAGTERGVTEPTATFSACFGAAFLTLHPTRYADLLQEKLETHGASAYLVNTGWTGGAYGVGERMSIKGTRACIDAILDGSIKDATFTEDPIFGFDVPTELPGVASNVCNPRDAWADKDAYDAQANKLAGMFKDNYVQYTGPGVTDYTKHGPK